MARPGTSQFTVRMSRDTYTQLRQQRKYLSEKKHAVLWNVIQEHLYLDVYEGIARYGGTNPQSNSEKFFLASISLI